MIGQTIAHYRVTAKLGQGGMGEVYQATDTKLDREVAIKVLPKFFAQDEQRLNRFEREAKALAALNHSNIAGIYGLEKTDDSQALILELVEGEDLSERLKRGPLPVEEALEVCKQIAEALEAAHEKGIIHRDLKPGNIKLLPDGRVKVLDFGLAKVVSDAPSMAQGSTELEDSPTVFTQGQATMPGVLLGTAGYMSPEQARGKLVDKRSDIWSFGVVLFECLTGGRLFPGETVTDSVGALLHKEIDWSLLPSNTPPTIQLLLRKCLARDRRRRLPDIAGARIDLEEAIADPSSSFLRLREGALQGPLAGTGLARTKVAALILLVALATAVTVWCHHRRRGDDCRQCKILGKRLQRLHGGSDQLVDPVLLPLTIGLRLEDAGRSLLRQLLRSLGFLLSVFRRFQSVSLGNQSFGGLPLGPAGRDRETSTYRRLARSNEIQGDLNSR